MKVLVLCPMSSELTRFKNALKGYKKTLKNEYHVYECGIGEIAASAFTAAELTRKPDYDVVAVVGFAAGSRNYTQGEMIAPTYVKSYLHSTELEKICTNDDYPFELELLGLDPCTIFSGDTFATKDIVKAAKKRFDAYECLFDMETLGIAYAAQMFNTPCIALRVVSDIPENVGTAQESNTKSFTEFVESYGDFYIPLSYLENLDTLVK